jgi:hypothetical protein
MWKRAFHEWRDQEARQAVVVPHRLKEAEGSCLHRCRRIVGNVSSDGRRCRRLTPGLTSIRPGISRKPLAGSSAQGRSLSSYGPGIPGRSNGSLLEWQRLDKKEDPAEGEIRAVISWT